MPIKQVEDLIEAFARGHEIICNACKCEDVRAKLFIRCGNLYHEDAPNNPLAFRITNKWVLNGNDKWPNSRMCECITIINPNRWTDPLDIMDDWERGRK